MSQLFHAVGMRNVERSVFHMELLKNRLMLVAAGLGLLLQLAVTEIGGLVRAFGTVQLSAGEWGMLLVLSSLPLVAHELLLMRMPGGAGRKKVP